MWNYAGAVPVEARGLGPVPMLTSHWTCAWLWAAVPGGVTAASPQHPGTEGLTTNPAATAVPRVPSLGTAFPGSGCDLARGTLGCWSHPLPPHHPGWAPELWTAPLLVTGGVSVVGVQPHVPRGLSPIYDQDWARSGAGGEGRATQSQSTLSPLCPGTATQLLTCWCLVGRD